MPHYNLPHNHGQNIEKVLNKMPSAEGFKDISFLFQYAISRRLWI